MSAKKTNAVRILDRHGVPYELRTYEVDPSDLSAETVARKVGLPNEQVLKTLVVRGDKSGVFFAVVPAGAELDKKAIARVTGDKSVEPVPLKEVEPLTGYIRGGVTALGAKRDFPVVIEISSREHPVVSLSAGVRGTQILLAPLDYAKVTRAQWGAISRSKSEGEPHT